MQKAKINLYVFLLACVATLSAAEYPFPHELNDLPPMAKIVWGRLDNGLRYAIIPNQEPPNRVSMRLGVMAGSMMETDAEQGIAHFTEHMAFNGTEHFQPSELMRYFQRIGMRLGEDGGAYTSFDRTVFNLDLPENTVSAIDDGLKVLRDFAGGVSFLPAEVDRERGVILAEKRTVDSASYRESIAELAFALKGLTMMQRIPIGTETCIRSFTSENFKDFYEREYRSDRMWLVVSGDLDVSKIKEQINAHFSTLQKPKQPYASPNMGAIANIQNDIVSFWHCDDTLPCTNLSVNFVHPYRSETRANNIRHLHETIVASILNKRFDKLRRSADSPFISCETNNESLVQTVNVFSVNLRCDSEKWRPSLCTIERELRRARLYGFAVHEIEEITKDLRNIYQDKVQSAPTIQSSDYAASILDNSLNAHVSTSPEEDLKIVNEAILLATPNRLLEVCRELLHGQTKIFAGSNIALPDAEKMLVDTYQQSQNELVAAMPTVKDKPFVYTNFGPTGEIVLDRKIDLIDAEQCVLANNVKINLKKTDFEKDTIRIVYRVGCGLLELPREKPGLAALIEHVWAQGGLEAHTFEEIQRIFAGKSCTVNFGVDYDAFVLQATTTREDLRDQMNLLCAYLTHPGWRTESEVTFKRSLDASYKYYRSTPSGVYALEGKRWLMGGDNRFGIPSLVDVNKWTLADAKMAMDEPLRKGYLEVTCVGDFDEVTLKNILRDTVGALPARAAQKPALNEARKTSPSPTGEAVFDVYSNVPKCLVTVTWPAPNYWNIDERRAYFVFETLFSNKLFDILRQQYGDSYSPHVQYDVSKNAFEGTCSLSAVTVTDPARAAEVVQTIKNLAKEILNNPIDDDACKRALEPTLNDVKKSKRNNGHWLAVLCNSQEYPQKITWEAEKLDAYSRLTPMDLQTVVQKYLHSDRAATIICTPNFF